MPWGFFQVLIGPVRMMDARNKDLLQKGGSIFPAAAVVAEAAVFTGICPPVKWVDELFINVRGDPTALAGALI